MRGLALRRVRDSRAPPSSPALPALPRGAREARRSCSSSAHSLRLALPEVEGPQRRRIHPPREIGIDSPPEERARVDGIRDRRAAGIVSEELENARRIRADEEGRLGRREK